MSKDSDFNVNSKKQLGYPHSGGFWRHDVAHRPDVTRGRRMGKVAYRRLLILSDLQLATSRGEGLVYLDHCKLSNSLLDNISMS